MPSNPGDGRDPRQRIIEAVLLACGELGYERLAVAEVISRAGATQAEFDERFSDLEQCFAAACAVEAERLSARLLSEAAARPSWRQGVAAGLEELASYLAERPRQARALLHEVHLAGGTAQRHRKELIDRLSAAMDSGRREPAGEPPPLTGLFMVGAVESAAAAALRRGEPRAFGEAVPEFAALIAAAYLRG